MKVTLVHGHSWSGLYIDGELAFDDSSIDVKDGLTACKGYVIDDVASRDLNDQGNDFVSDFSFPSELADFSEEMFL